jgi:hypothetical protein
MVSPPLRINQYKQFLKMGCTTARVSPRPGSNLSQGDSSLKEKVSAAASSVQKKKMTASINNKRIHTTFI